MLAYKFTKIINIYENLQIFKSISEKSKKFRLLNLSLYKLVSCSLLIIIEIYESVVSYLKNFKLFN